MTNIKHFIEQHIESDLAAGLSRIRTRFPPEPNGYLHIGHAKSICLNFGMAHQYHGHCMLRFDDTNPAKEDTLYMGAIKKDVRWLGFEWTELHHAADYFEPLHQFAIQLIQQGDAYVCSLSSDEIREQRGTLTEPGINSPYRNRTVDENLELFEKMRLGVFEEGQQVLRAKIDMASGNINFRDPIIYRILKQSHPHVGDQWCIYPMYDFAHALSDAIEKITHSLCTLEFQDHKPLYEWFLQKLIPHQPHPKQIEFSRLNLSHTVTSKRKLKMLVDGKQVEGWDDPRLPTLVGLRRRGIPPNAIKTFCQKVGISKSDSIIDMGVLEQCVRDDLNQRAPRAFAILNPLKVTITNLDEAHCEYLDVPNHPQNPELGTRSLPFRKYLYIEQKDFMEDPQEKYKRLAPDREVRLRYGYIIICDEVMKDPDTGKVLELRCRYHKETLGKNPEGRKVKGVIHWLTQADARGCEIRLYDRLFNVENPSAVKDREALFAILNPESLEKMTEAYVESHLVELDASHEQHYQFERLGYFMKDPQITEKLVFNRVVGLRNTWENQMK